MRVALRFLIHPPFDPPVSTSWFGLAFFNFSLSPPIFNFNPPPPPPLPFPAPSVDPLSLLSEWALADCVAVFWVIIGDLVVRDTVELAMVLLLLAG